MLKFPFSKYLQQTYCAFLIMQSKKRALYLWISEKKKAYTSSNVHSFTLYTDRHWNQEAEGWPNIPVHHSSQTHSNDALSKRGTPSVQSGFVRCSHIYTFIYIQTDRRPGLQFVSELKALLWLFNCTDTWRVRIFWVPTQKLIVVSDNFKDKTKGGKKLIPKQLSHSGMLCKFDNWMNKTILTYH